MYLLIQIFVFDAYFDSPHVVTVSNSVAEAIEIEGAFRKSYNLILSLK